MACYTCISCEDFVANTDEVYLDPVGGDGPICRECYEDLLACAQSGIFVLEADNLKAVN